MEKADPVHQATRMLSGTGRWQSIIPVSAFLSQPFWMSLAAFTAAVRVFPPPTEEHSSLAVFWNLTEAAKFLAVLRFPPETEASTLLSCVEGTPALQVAADRIAQRLGYAAI